MAISTKVFRIMTILFGSKYNVSKKFQNEFTKNPKKKFFKLFFSNVKCVNLGGTTQIKTIENQMATCLYYSHTSRSISGSHLEGCTPMTMAELLPNTAELDFLILLPHSD